MGRDLTVSGVEYNSKMSYTKGGRQPASQLNRVGRSLNLLSGSYGVNIARGLNGGIEIQQTNFPWFELSFGYGIGYLADYGLTMDYEKITIEPGFIHYGQGADTEIDSVDERAVITVTGDLEIEEPEATYIYLKYEYSANEGERASIVPQDVVISSSSGRLEPTDEYMYIPLYAFGLQSGEAILLSIFHMGDVWVPKLSREWLVYDVEWDADTCTLKQKKKEYYVLNTEEENTTTETILTAESCP